MADDDRIVNYRLDCAALGGTVPPLRHVHLVEALNEPFHLRVDCELEDISIELKDAIGQNATLEMRRGADAFRRVCGVVREVDEMDTRGTRMVRFHIVPALWKLSQIRNTRIFQNLSVKEILADVLGGSLGAYGRACTDELGADYPTREYCVQYQETDLDFCHRLMEEEGIGYHFLHDGDVEEMVLRDDNMSYPEILNGPEVRYVPISAQLKGLEPVVQFMRRHRPVTTSVQVRDWDWTKGGNMVVEGTASGTDEDGRDRESYEHSRGRSLTIWSYDQGARRYQQNDSAEQPTTRQEAHGHEEVRGCGVSLHLGMTPGVRYDLSGHPSPGADDSYLVTKVIHQSVNIGEVLDGAGGGISDPYTNTFESIPVGTKYRPYRGRTPKPFIPSVQTAVVTGPNGQEIWVDEHGRIKVQFHWDREGQLDQHTTCWIRVQQPWAGAGWGFWWVPRIGMEVLVHFVDGDPDRPVVTSSVYNGANPTPYTLDDHKTKSTIKSNSSLGGGGFNEFRFEDLKGQEEIFTHAQKDYNEVVENNHSTLVHHDQTNTVDNDQTQEIHVDQIEKVDGDQTLTVDGNRTVVVHSDYDETVDGTETRHTVGDVSETFEANETRTVLANLTEDIGGNETRNITGDQSETIGADHSQTIDGSASETILGSLSEKVVSGITTTTPAAYNITVGAAFSLNAAAGMKLTAPGGTLILAPGGVTRVDSFMDWQGVEDINVGVIEYGKHDIKIGVVYFALGFQVLKLEDTGITLISEGIKLWQETLGIEAIKMEMKSGAVTVNVNTEVKG